MASTRQTYRPQDVERLQRQRDAVDRKLQIQEQAVADVGTLHPARKRMGYAWELIDDLMVGQRRMEEAAEDWLPMLPDEQDPHYIERLRNATLWPGYRDAVERLTVKPFANPVTLLEAESLPEPLADIAEDTDGEGTDITQLAREVLKWGVAKGHCFVIVDHPSLGDDANAKTSRQEEARPLFRFVDPADVVGWKVDQDSAGRRSLAEVRIRETRTEDVEGNDWGQVEVEYVRVIRAPGYGEEGGNTGTWELHRLDPLKNEWSLETEGEHEFDGIPLVCFYFNRTGFLESRPPLEDLAWMNLAHWRSDSRQRQYLWVLRTAALIGTGIQPPDEDPSSRSAIVFHPGHLNTFKSDTAKVYFASPDKVSADAGWEDLRRLEEQVMRRSIEPMQNRAGNPTATGKAIEAGKANTDVQAWVRVVESGLTQCYEMAAEWLNIGELPEGFGVDIWTEFKQDMLGPVNAELILKAVIAGKFPVRYMLAEWQRLGIYDARIPVEDVEAALTEQKEAEMQAMREAMPESPDIGADDEDGQGEAGDGEEAA